MAHNSFYTVAAMQGSEKAGSPIDYLQPPMTKEDRKEHNDQVMDSQLDAIESDLGL